MDLLQERRRHAPGHVALSGQSHPGVLYMSYDVMLEPLGQGQVIAYLERLSSEFRIHLVSFEKPADLVHVPALRALETRLAHPVTDAWNPFARSVLGGSQGFYP